MQAEEKVAAESALLGWLLLLPAAALAWPGPGALLADDPEHHYVDVRSIPEFQAGHPKGAYCVPVLHRESLIYHADVEGNTSGWATQGQGADICAADGLEAMPYTRVNIQGGNSAFAPDA